MTNDGSVLPPEVTEALGRARERVNMRMAFSNASYQNVADRALETAEAELRNVYRRVALEQAHADMGDIPVASGTTEAMEHVLDIYRKT